MSVKLVFDMGHGCRLEADIANVRDRTMEELLNKGRLDYYAHRAAAQVLKDHLDKTLNVIAAGNVEEKATKKGRDR